MSTTTTARTFIGLNAAFSALTGLELIIFPFAVAHLMFSDPAGWTTLALRLLGVGLVLFALDLLLMATNRFVTKGEVMLIILADIGWLIASAALVLLTGYLFSDAGLLMIGIVAAFVAVFAAGQYVGAGRIVAPQSRVSIRSKNGKLSASVRRVVAAPAETAWEVMTDHPGYADVAGNISKVEVLAGEGIGMTRRCFGPKGENWTETCNQFQEGRSYGFRIHTEAPDYPYPISDLQGRWSVEPKGPGSEFSIDIEAKPKGGFLSRALFASVARRQFKSILVDLADAWAKRMEHEART
ncbi:SRPBCC family protein [Anderseniella sp. Alg231-50]|uniref:SRPBCC family protein n=1 Tax=Anderseniella sp. Alg231-50 TaxID=1922226 RepID=UPI000D555FE4